MSRIVRFHALKFHPMNGKIFNKLSENDRQVCREFIESTEHLSDNEFIERVNRAGLSTSQDLKGGKNMVDMWSLLVQSISPQVRS